MNKIICAVLIVTSFSSCNKFLDINADPNNPLEVNERLILAPVTASVATNLAGGCFSLANYNGISMITSYWTQQIALNQEQPQIDGYRCKPDDVDQAWLTNYATIMGNLKKIESKATANGNNAYNGIAKVLLAYTLGNTTDLWGDVPYSKAFLGREGQYIPTYDAQENVYKSIQSLLDSAIVLLGKNTGPNTPKGDDLIYSGNKTKWLKCAYALKARYHIHLTKAQGYNATTQATLALAAIGNAFSMIDDQAVYANYSATPGSESPWFMNTAEAQGGVVLASTLIDSLVARNDPRLSVIATLGRGGNYFGRIIGTNAAADYKIYSLLNSFYAAENAQQIIMGYVEQLFIQAEATLIVNGATAALPIFENAINASMEWHKLSTTNAAVVAYIAARKLAFAQSPLKTIMEDKAVGNLLSPENYVDYRRTGFPDYKVVANSFLPAIPQRAPYPLNERSANEQPQHAISVATPVWWAK